jgi:hypothetical protein
MFCNMCTETCVCRDICTCQMAEGIKWTKHVRRVFSIGQTGRPSGKRCAFHKQRYGSDKSSRSDSRAVSWYSHNSTAMWCQIHCSSCLPAAVMASSLSDASTVLGAPTFASAKSVTRPVSRRRCSNLTNIAVHGWSRPLQSRARSRAVVPAWLLEAPKVKGMSRYSCVHYASIGLGLNPAVQCVSGVHLTMCCTVMAKSPANCFAPLGGDVCIEN